MSVAYGHGGRGPRSASADFRTGGASWPPPDPFRSAGFGRGAPAGAVGAGSARRGLGYAPRTGLC